jgi:TetR/AcrR family transcriptional repressor of nem operon
MRCMSTIHDGGTASRGPGRPREFAVGDVLDKAIIVFSELGFHATSMARLTGALEIAEGSLYKAFKDKRGIFLAAFERYVGQRNERMARELAGARTGRECVEAILRLYAEYSHGAAGRRGCLVVGSAVDLASSDAEMAKRVTGVLKVHEKRVVDAIRRGQEDGSISSRLDAESMGRLLLCVVQGMRVLGKTGRSHGEMMGVVENALKLLD